MKIIPDNEDDRNIANQYEKVTNYELKSRIRFSSELSLLLYLASRYVPYSKLDDEVEKFINKWAPKIYENDEKDLK